MRNLNIDSLSYDQASHIIQELIDSGYPAEDQKLKHSFLKLANDSIKILKLEPNQVDSYLSCLKDWKSLPEWLQYHFSVNILHNKPSKNLNLRAVIKTHTIYDVQNQLKEFIYARHNVDRLADRDRNGFIKKLKSIHSNTSDQIYLYYKKNSSSIIQLADEQKITIYQSHERVHQDIMMSLNIFNQVGELNNAFINDTK